ncbi:MBG domain-containing protein [Pedobacter boryungensis]|nr:MBG domain-containing protein [Pedobacter boryungensis]
MTSFAQKNYHVGPGQTMTKLSQVPWNTLGAGDIVSIHYDPNPYREKFLISTSGEPGNPITILGIPGPNGEKPIIDGENATSDPQKLAFPNTDVFGLIFIGPGTGAGSYGPIPHDIIIDNLEIRNAHPTKTFTTASAPQTKVAYDVFSAGIYAERVQDLVVRNCNINNCGIGLFINSKFLYHAHSKNILIEKNTFTKIGVVGDFHDHGLYVEAENVVYQYNFFDKLIDGALGASLKDRSSGNIFRYNYIVSSAGHAVQIAEPQGGIGVLDLLPSYKETFMYGNVIFSDVDGATRFIRYGGDQGEYKYYRPGTLHFYNNTVVIERNKTYNIDPSKPSKAAYDVSLFLMADGGDIAGGDTVTITTKVDMRNNIIYGQAVPGSPAGTIPSQLNILSTNLSGEVNMRNNWLSPHVVDLYEYNTSGGGKKPNAGRVTHINDMYGNMGLNDPGFKDYANKDFSLLPTSNAIDGGTTLSTAATNYPVLEEYINHMKAKTRTLTGTIDIGAFESSVPALNNGYPKELTTTYGAADFNPAGTASANPPIPYNSSDLTVATIVAGKIHIVGAGKTVIKASVAGQEYVLNLTVNKAMLTIKPDVVYKKVGAPVPSNFKVTYKGFVNGENETVLTKLPTVTTNATANSPIVSPINQTNNWNPYPLVANGATAANYQIVYVNGVMNMYDDKKLAQHISFNLESAATYGDSDFDPNAWSDNPTIPITYTSSDPKVATIVNNKIHVVGIGTTTITVNQPGNAIFLDPVNRYGNSPVTGTLEVQKATLNIKADSKSITAGSPIPPLTGTITGFVLGQDKTVLTKQPTYTTTATATSPPGTYKIIASAATAANYFINYVSGTLTITSQATIPQVIKFDPLAAVTYGTADIPLTATSDNNKIQITYLSSNTSVATIVGGKLHITGAGTADITASQAGDATYISAKDVVQVLTVNKAPLTITADPKTKQEGSANPALTASFSGFVNGENQTALITQPTLTTTATIASTPGDYPITASSATANNYLISYVPGILKVTANPNVLTPQTINLPSTATATYGDADFVPGATSSNNTIQITYQSSNPLVATIVNGKIHIKGAGTTTITASQPGDSKYSPATDVMQTLTVKKATLLISADIQVKIAGTPNPIFTVSYFGFVYGEDVKVLTSPPSITTNATVTSPAGVYPLTVSGATADNYNIAYSNSTLTISNALRIPITLSDVTNILSPNADGINDYWIIKNIKLYPENHVRVLDLTGRIVFEKRNYDNTWDGKYKGKNLGTGAYIFLIEPGDGHEKLKGTLTIIP